MRDWLGAAGTFELGLLLVAALAAILVLDRACRRPDFPVQGLYLEAGLGAVTGIAVTIPPLGALALPTFISRILIFLSVAGLAILRPGRARAGRGLWAAAIAVPVATLLTDQIVGIDFVLVDRSFSVHHRIFLLLGVTALFVAPRLEVETVVRLAKAVLGTYLVASLATFVAGFPDATTTSLAVLPGMDERASGIFRHANHLGPAAVLYLIVDHIRPSRRLVRIGMGTLALTLLVLAQSKTAWVAAVAVTLVLVAGRWEPRRALAASALFVAVATPAAIGAGIEPGDIVREVPVPHVETLTGRTDLWDMGLERWREAPIVGHGTGVFLDIAEETGERWRAQAHNEYIQALAESGLIGLATVVVYLLVLVRTALRHAVATRNGSLALVTLLFLQTLTEVHLVSFDLPHMTVLALLFAWERRAQSAPAALVAAPGDVDRGVASVPAPGAGPGGRSPSVPG